MVADVNMSEKLLEIWGPFPEKNTNVFIRTVTMAYTGRLVDVTEKELVLEDACWIADTGRFATFLEMGSLNEVEPFPAGRIIVGRGALIDLCAWKHELPRKQM